MSRRVETVSADTSLHDIARAMGSQRHSCVVVCDGTRPIGVVSERDLVRAFAGGVRGAAVAADIMSTPVITMRADRPLAEATRRLTNHHIRRLVIVDAFGSLCGLLTQTDLVRAHVERIERHQELLEAKVAERTRALEAANARLERLARIDPLLGIGNRRAMEEALAVCHQRARRYRRGYSVILLDADCFKRYNDRYGHQQGDSALFDLATEVSASIRVLDAAYRYGGEEILVILPETDTEGAFAVAERVRSAVEALAIEHADSPHGVLTISAGVATAWTAPDGDYVPVTEVLAAADNALYAAKHAGRNRLAVADTGLSQPVCA